MSQRDSRAFVSDIIRGRDGILSRVACKSIDDYKNEETLRLACERLLSVIGEACSQLRRTSPELAAQLGNVERIIAFRNILIH